MPPRRCHDRPSPQVPGQPRGSAQRTDAGQGPRPPKSSPQGPPHDTPTRRPPRSPERHHGTPPSPARPLRQPRAIRPLAPIPALPFQTHPHSLPPDLPGGSAHRANEGGGQRPPPPSRQGPPHDTPTGRPHRTLGPQRTPPSPAGSLRQPRTLRSTITASRCQTHPHSLSPDVPGGSAHRADEGGEQRPLRPRDKDHPMTPRRDARTALRAPTGRLLPDRPHRQARLG